MRGFHWNADEMPKEAVHTVSDRFLTSKALTLVRDDTGDGVSGWRRYGEH